MSEEESLDRKSVTVSLTTVEKLLRKHHVLAEEDITWLMSDAIENIELESPVIDSNRKVFPAAKFRVEYDEDLEVDVTYAFKDLAIIVLRQKRQEE